MHSEDELRKKLSGLFDDFEAEAQDESWDVICNTVSERQTFSNIFADFEAEPQPETWQSIKIAADDNFLKNNLSAAFNDFEVEPQDESWQIIKETTEDNILKSAFANSFGAFEAEPQSETWDVIKSGVEDEKLKGILGSVFADFEAEPQADSWNNINSNVEDTALKGILAETFSDFEAQPAENSWDFIQANLENDLSLRNELSSIFADYEVEPTAESWVTIKANIQKEDDDRGIIIPLFYRVGIAASIALLLGFFLWNYNKVPDNQSVISQNNSGKSKNKVVKEGNQKPKNELPKIIEKPEFNPENKSLDNQSLVKNIIQNSQSEFASNRTKSKQNIQTKPINDLPIVNSENIASNEPKSSSPLNSVNEGLDVATSLPTISGIESKEFNGDNFKKEPLVIAQNNEEEEIYPEIEPERRSRNPLILTGNLMPIQTYQVFTILPQTSTTYIQQVGQLSTLDNQRLGVQARLGVMKNLTRKSSVGISLAYTGMQQWANYSVSNGIYDVTVGANDEITVTPVTESVAEESFLHALGLKFEQSYMVAKRRSKIYLIGGGEAVRKLNKNQFGYYLNASIGVSYPIAKNNSLWIEPTIRYGLTSTFDNNNYLKIRPYNIGLNFRVNIGK
ncbi:MAG: hypothetical protein ACK4NY_19105 [Spirosomataceae bacterium]